MKFELKNYTRSRTDAEILSDIRRVSEKLGTDYLPLSVYKANGKYSQCAIQGHFGTWKRALYLAGLRNERTRTELKRVSDEDYYRDIRRVRELVGGMTVSLKDYERMGRYSSGNIFRRFGDWDSFLTLAGLEPTGLSKKKVSVQECFDEIERIWILLGRQPTTTDIVKYGVSKFSIDTYKRRFGGWYKALEAFVAHMNEGTNNEDSGLGDSPSKSEDDVQTSSEIEKDRVFEKRVKHEHRTSRNINARLRFQVLKRDHFKCCSCGASPAKDPSVELHVDHIRPWAKGGETVVENLQTLCSQCNLGKGDA